LDPLLETSKTSKNGEKKIFFFEKKKDPRKKKKKKIPRFLGFSRFPITEVDTSCGDVMVVEKKNK
jgi:hypothetical protein